MNVTRRIAPSTIAVSLLLLGPAQAANHDLDSQAAFERHYGKVPYQLLEEAPARGFPRTKLLSNLGGRAGGFDWWNGFGGGTSPGSSVNALTTWGANLAVGGDFLDAGGGLAHRVAVWDGATWTNVASGVNGRVFALLEFNGDLIIAGDFTNAGPQPALNVVAWDGAQFSSFGDGPGGPVYSLGIFQGLLTAGGAFPGHIAQWDGARWVLIGGGAEGPVLAMAEWSGSLFVGGSFLEPQNRRNIKRWNAALTTPTWQSLQTGTDDWVSAMIIRSDSLWVGGNFDQTHTLPAAHVGVFKPSTPAGGTWRSINGGVATNGAVLSLADFNGEIVAAGDFDTVNGATAASNIAAFNGSGWTNLGLGLTGPMFRPVGRALHAHGGDLFVGGWFEQAGGNPSFYVGRWTDNPGPGRAVSAGNLPVEAGLGFRASPNPFRSETGVTFSLKAPGTVHLTVHDVQGRLVTTILSGPSAAGPNREQWNGRDRFGQPVANGVYYLRLRTEDGRATKPVVLTR